MFQNRVLHLAALAALAIFLGAGSAWAQSDESQELCGDPTTAADDISNYYEDNTIDTTGWEEQDCTKLCTKMGKACDKRAKSDGKCVKDIDKFAFKLAKALCDDDEECRDGVKQDVADAREARKAAKQTAGDNCDALAEQCLTECAAGEVFDDGLPPPL